MNFGIQQWSGDIAKNDIYLFDGNSKTLKEFIKLKQVACLDCIVKSPNFEKTLDGKPSARCKNILKEIRMDWRFSSSGLPNCVGICTNLPKHHYMKQIQVFGSDFTDVTKLPNNTEKHTQNGRALKAKFVCYNETTATYEENIICKG